MAQLDLVAVFERLDAFVTEHPAVYIREGMSAFLEKHPEDLGMFVTLQSQLASITEFVSVPFSRWVAQQKDIIYILGIVGGMIQDGVLGGPPSVTSEANRRVFQWLQERDHKVTRETIEGTLPHLGFVPPDMDEFVDAVARFADIADVPDEGTDGTSIWIVTTPPEHEHVGLPFDFVEAESASDAQILVAAEFDAEDRPFLIAISVQAGPAVTAYAKMNRRYKGEKLPWDQTLFDAQCAALIEW